jgi:hypothetical protein
MLARTCILPACTPFHPTSPPIRDAFNIGEFCLSITFPCGQQLVAEINPGAPLPAVFCRLLCSIRLPATSMSAPSLPASPCCMPAHTSASVMLYNIGEFY